MEQEQNPQYLIMQIPDEAMQGSQAQINVREYSDLVLLIPPFLLFLATPYLVSFLFALHMNRRLKQLTIAMNDVNAEKSVVTIKDQTKDEIGQLTHHFNTMSERITKQVAQIQEYESDKKSMIANLSHDLRTPLTKIQGYAETLQEELDSIALGDTVKESKSFAYIIRKQLLQRLLEISDLDTRRGNVELTESNICAQLRKIAADYVPVLENKGMDFNIQIPDQPIYALTDPYLFERAIRNVIENAIQYGSSGHYLGVALDKVEDAVRIRIIDRGPGIPKEQIPFIFERFYRGSAAREGEGMGIGLSIVQEIAAAHHGTVDVHSVTNEKTVFSMTIPESPIRSNL